MPNFLVLRSNRYFTNIINNLEFSNNTAGQLKNTLKSAQSLDLSYFVFNGYMANYLDQTIIQYLVSLFDVEIVYEPNVFLCYCSGLDCHQRYFHRVLSQSFLKSYF